LADASRARRFGRFQFEAAIQSAHAKRARSGRADWDAIALLYEGLVRGHPTIGALVGRAAAVAEAKNVSAGWALLEAIPGEDVAFYQPYWALAAYLLSRMQWRSEAEAAYRRAIGLCEDAAMREFLAKQLQKLAKN
jgi:RNA polymerase sigma-70 factor (ECF subfamily)